MSQSFEIRKATRDDMDNLIKLSMELADGYFAMDRLYMPGRERKSELRRFYSKALAGHNKYLILVAEQGNSIIGCVNGKTEEARKGICTSRVGYIGGLYVIPSARKIGVGSSLIKSLLDWLKIKNVKIVEAYADVRNAASLKILKKSGFDDGQTLMVARFKKF